MFKRILVPLDGSKVAEVVLPYVCEITSRFGSRTTLIRVPESDSTTYECQAYLDNTAEGLTRQIKGWHGTSKGVVEPLVLTGKPASIILDCAQEMDCNLIIMASRGASNRNRWPLGNVATKILRSTDFPVLLVKNPAEPQAEREKKLIGRIMVTLDGSRLSESALPLAEQLSLTLGAEVALFRVIDPEIVMSGPGVSATHLMSSEYSSTIVSSSVRPFVIEYLNAVKESFTKKGIKTSIVLKEGLPADQIIEYSESNPVDLVVMSTHGWSGIGRWVFGSVTERVVQTGWRPVLVSRPTNV